MSDQVARPSSAAPRSTLLWALAAAVLGGVLVVVAPDGAFALAGIVAAGVGVSAALRRPEFMLAALVGSAALDASGRLGAVGDAKVTFYQAVFLVSVCVYIWLVSKGRERLPSTVANWWVLLLALAGLVAIPGAVSPQMAAVAWVSLVSSIGLVYFVVAIANTPARLKFVLTTLVVVAAVLAVLALLEWRDIYSVQSRLITYKLGVRARVTFTDPNIFGGVLAAAVAVGTSLAITERVWFKAIARWGLAGITLAGVVTTSSRGALLGLLVGLAVVLVATPMRLRSRALVLGGSVGMVAVLALWALGPAWIAERVSNIDTDASALDRVYLARSGMRMFQAHPLGIGPGNWTQVIPAFRDQMLPASLLESHTTAVTILVEEGLLGLIGYLGVLASVIFVTIRAAYRAADREVRVLASSALAGMAVLLTQSFTYSMDTSKFLWLTVGAGLAAWAMARVRKSEEIT
jgi:O-antigen ligase